MAEGRRNSKVNPSYRDHGFRDGWRRKKIREGGCDAYIVKPISIPNFLQTVERLAKPLVAEREPNPAECETIGAEAEN